MSSLLGGPRDRFPLDAAVDELAASGRWAGRPGLVWFAGIFYPSMMINIEAVRTLVSIFELALGRDLALPFFTGERALSLPLSPIVPIHPESPGELLLMTLVWIVPALIMYRLNVGLAVVAAPDAAREDRTLIAVWRAGRGLGFTAFAMWLTLIGLLVGVMGFLFGPTVLLIHTFGLDEAPGLLALLVLPVMLLILGYGFVLLVLHMLALQSLAQNRRGVGSALTHAWRLIRGEPWGVVRASLVDLSLHLVVFVVSTAGTLALSYTFLGYLSGATLQVLLLGAAGTTRAAFWARTYRGLGGPLASENLPGLTAASG